MSTDEIWQNYNDKKYIRFKTTGQSNLHGSKVEDVKSQLNVGKRRQKRQDSCNNVRNALEERFDPIIEDSILNIQLDPHFKNHLLPIEKKKHIIQENFSEKVSAIHTERNINSGDREQNNVQSTSENDQMKSKLPDFFNKTLGNPDGGMETFNARKNREIQMYL